MIDIDIVFPRNNATFLAGRNITVRGRVTWTDDMPTNAVGLPFNTLVLTAHESRFNGAFFSRWVAVGDVDISSIDRVDSNSARWEHDIIPFDGMAKYLLNVVALDADNEPIANSDALLIKSVE